jgi:hypothetical protein
MSWDYREYLRQRKSFLANRGEYHPMVLATTLIFSATWLAGWLFSSLLLWRGMHSMPLRYGLAFLVSYAVFFLCVRVWCNSVHHDRGGNDGSLDFPGFDGEGCLMVLAIALAALLVAGLFWASGGFAALLEVAFEVAFAGTVVRRLGRTEIVGNWAGRLFAGTWLQALVALLLLVGVAAWLQHKAPSATKFSEAVAIVFRAAR